ncbi:MAG TPA: ATP-binding protein [Candidatus Acidoferrales bacterium]|nr:ATP-binding protein [Candidatus Acidoferrales bacterium]
MAEPSRAPPQDDDVLALAPIAYHEVDLQGNLVWVNDAECRLLGRTREELIGRPVWELVSEAEQPESRSALARKLSSEVSLAPFERTLTRPDGAIVVVEIHDTYRLNPRGDIEGIRSFLLDVTARKRAQEALRKVGEDLESRVRERTQELELAIDFLRREIDEHRQAEDERRRLEAQVRHTQRLESIGVLAGGIAHEFNNLLTSITGYASLAATDLPAGTAAHRHIGQVLAAAKNAADLTRQILAYAGRSQFVPELVNLSGMVSNTVRLIESMISKRATLKLDLAAEVPRIEGDSGQLRQVILNLATNASDALGDQPGEVRIATGLIWLEGGELPSLKTGRVMPAGLYVWLEVADTGAGMDRATLDRIFDPFFSTKFTGRGLGLAAVMGIVRAHRGSITVASEPGRGATFRVFFPAVDEAERQPAVPAPAVALSEWQGTGAVLVVDDEEPIRTLAKTILEGAGLPVLTAADGDEALEVFREHKEEIHAVLLDVVMPGTDAAEVLARISEARPKAKVIVCSGYHDHDAAKRLGGGTPAGFLRKPYDPAGLLARLKELW